MNETIPIEGLLRGRAGFLLSYPRYEAEEAERRLRELRDLGIRELELRGRHEVRGILVLGKGHVGVVVAARLGCVSVALKMRRVDADRASLETEAANLRVANRVSVGPGLVDASPNFLVMELVDGCYLADWVEGLGPSDGGRLGRVLGCLLEKARRLDSAGLDHGELSRADRHVIVVGDEPRIVDFESASTKRRCSNVTSVAHYLFFSRRMRGLIGRIRPLPDGDVLVGALGAYRRAPGAVSFRRVLEVCGVAA